MVPYTVVKFITLYIINKLFTLYTMVKLITVCTIGKFSSPKKIDGIFCASCTCVYHTSSYRAGAG